MAAFRQRQNYTNTKPVATAPVLRTLQTVLHINISFFTPIAT